MNDDFTTPYILKNRQRLAECYGFVTEFLKHYQIPYRPCNSAFFLWIQLGAVVADQQTTDDDILGKLHEHKVYIAAGYAYASEESGWFRMVFAHPTEVLQEGLRRMVQALGLQDTANGEK